MPNTRGAVKKRKGNEVKGGVIKKTPVKKAKQDNPKESKASATRQKKPTAYEKLYAKWAATKNKDKKADNKNIASKESSGSKKSPTNPAVFNANFVEEDNFVDMEITEAQNQEFPHSSEDEASSDSEEGEIGDETMDSNNNAMTV